MVTTGLAEPSNPGAPGPQTYPSNHQPSFPEPAGFHSGSQTLGPKPSKQAPFRAPGGPDLMGQRVKDAPEEFPSEVQLFL